MVILQQLEQVLMQSKEENDETVRRACRADSIGAKQSASGG